MSWRRDRARLLRTLAVAALLGALVAALVATPGCGRLDGDSVVVTVPVELDSYRIPDATKIGIVLTLGESTSEGADWAQAAQGAAVAQARLAWGGNQLDLVVEDDRGTTRGATAAVQALAGRGVSAVVVASAGPHIVAALRAASSAELPVVLPYATIPAQLRGAPGIWSLAPEEPAIRVALSRRLSEFAAPLHLDLGTGVSRGFPADHPMSPTIDVSELARQAAVRTGADPSAGGAYSGGDTGAAPAGVAGWLRQRADAVVITGPAQAMAQLVAALQSRRVTVPIILGPAAVSPKFAQVLEASGGTLSPSLETLGLATADEVALRPDARGRSMSAFLQALRQLAADGDATNLTDDAAFESAAQGADARSHDAVLAIAAAVTVAHSSDPRRISRALGRLDITAGDGIAGPALDFSRPQANTAPV